MRNRRLIISGRTLCRCGRSVDGRRRRHEGSEQSEKTRDSVVRYRRRCKASVLAMRRRYLRRVLFLVLFPVGAPLSKLGRRFRRQGAVSHQGAAIDGPMARWLIHFFPLQRQKVLDNPQCDEKAETNFIAKISRGKFVLLSAHPPMPERLLFTADSCLFLRGSNWTEKLSAFRAAFRAVNGNTAIRFASPPEGVELLGDFSRRCFVVVVVVVVL